jgi:nitrite reductase/ring-hydroxylating ferredoxin subunit
MRVSAGPIADIPENRCQPVGEGAAIVIRVADRVVAFQNRCLHQNSPLEGGIVLDGFLICPLHFWRYRLPAGRHLSGTALPSYPVELTDGEVFVDIPDPAPPISMREMLLKHAREWRAGQ